jgi:hypothetical protein
MRFVAMHGPWRTWREHGHRGNLWGVASVPVVRPWCYGPLPRPMQSDKEDEKHDGQLAVSGEIWALGRSEKAKKST